MLLSEAGHGAEGAVAEYWDLMGDPAHWAFELTTDLLVFLLGALFTWVLARPWIKARIIREHDEKYHGGGHSFQGTDEEWDALDPKEQMLVDYSRWLTPEREAVIERLTTSTPPIKIDPSLAPGMDEYGGPMWGSTDTEGETS